MIASQSVAIQFGGEYLFRDVTFTINPGDRIGLVGANGAGKSTLMKVLIGRQQPDEGRVAASRHAVVGYLPQEGVVLSDDSVRDEVMKAFGEVNRLESAIEEMTAEVARLSSDPDSPQLHALVEELGDLQHRFESMNGFSAAGEVEKVLSGLGFLPEDFNRSCKTFSGGWQMRIELAKLLLRQPDLLMLDEPTNHLDIESLTWIESFLQRYQGAILLISHDRTFLDSLCTRIFELYSTRLNTYTGNYTRYLEQRTERRVLQQSAYENQQKLIAETEEFIERFRYKATKATQVQSRVKMLDKLERVLPPEPEAGSVHFQFPAAPRSGRLVAEVLGLVKRYDDNLVLDGVDFAIERGEKIAFLGRNGEGKSTLSRIIAGIEPYQAGTRTIGTNVSIGYYAQHQAEDLDPRKTVLQTLDDVATGDVRTKLRTLLGAFLFQGDDVFKPVGVLSGGEKSRLALAKLLLEPVNLLILDEPTNHLDMASKEVLKEALVKFDGAIIVVSHDRAFLSGVVGKCIEFRSGATREFLGGIEDYLRAHKISSVDEGLARKRPSQSDVGDASGGGDQSTRKEQKRLEAELRNKRYAATKDLKKKLEKIESSIATAEEEKGRLQEQLTQPETYSDAAAARELQKSLADIETSLAEMYTQWQEIAEKIDELESAIG